MPDYCHHVFRGYHLYFMSYCIVEVFHAHASKDRKRRGSVVIAKPGDLGSRTIRDIVDNNYVKMFVLWQY